MMMNFAARAQRRGLLRALFDAACCVYTCRRLIDHSLIAGARGGRLRGGRPG